jgi:hypothetical protein
MAVLSMREVDRINERLNPGEMKMYGFVVWFRGYIPSYANDYLVGWWLACYPGGNLNFAVACGDDKVTPYVKGSNFEIPECAKLFLTNSEEDLINASTKAKRALLDYIDTNYRKT